MPPRRRPDGGRGRADGHVRFALLPGPDDAVRARLRLGAAAVSVARVANGAPLRRDAARLLSGSARAPRLGHARARRCRRRDAAGLRRGSHPLRCRRWRGGGHRLRADEAGAVGAAAAARPLVTSGASDGARRPRRGGRSYGRLRHALARGRCAPPSRCSCIWPRPRRRGSVRSRICCASRTSPRSVDEHDRHRAVARARPHQRLDGYRASAAATRTSRPLFQRPSITPLISARKASLATRSSRAPIPRAARASSRPSRSMGLAAPWRRAGARSGCTKRSSRSRSARRSTAPAPSSSSSIGCFRSSRCRPTRRGDRPAYSPRRFRSPRTTRRRHPRPRGCRRRRSSTAARGPRSRSGAPPAAPWRAWPASVIGASATPARRAASASKRSSAAETPSAHRGWRYHTSSPARDGSSRASRALPSRTTRRPSTMSATSPRRPSSFPTTGGRTSTARSAARSTAPISRPSSALPPTPSRASIA